MYNTDNMIRELYGNITAYIKVIEDQFRDHTVTGYEPRLEVYVPKAMTEYRFYLSRYHQWESQGSTQAPGMCCARDVTSLSNRTIVRSYPNVRIERTKDSN
jgi:hypothetical protein